MPETMIPWEKAAFKAGYKEGFEIGFKEGVQIRELSKHIIIVLEARFEKVPRAIVSSLKKVDNFKTMESLLKESVKVTSLGEFKKVLNTSNG